jgi:hypothetical protein
MNSDDITLRFEEQNGKTVLLVIGRCNMEVIGEDGQLLPYIRSVSRPEMSQQVSPGER